MIKTETNNEVSANFSDEYKARLIVGDLLSHRDLGYWNERIGELEELAVDNSDNSDFLFPLIVLTKKAPPETNFINLVLRVVKGHGLLYSNELTVNEDVHLKYAFSMLIGRICQEESTFDETIVKNTVNLLENYTLSELMVEFPDELEKAQNTVARRLQKG